MAILADEIRAISLTLWPPVTNIFGFSFFYYHIKYYILNMLKIICDNKSAGIEKSWPSFWQIWIFFTHLKLWIASERHNFKWVKIPISLVAQLIILLFVGKKWRINSFTFFKISILHSASEKKSPWIYFGQFVWQSFNVLAKTWIKNHEAHKNMLLKDGRWLQIQLIRSESYI